MTELLAALGVFVIGFVLGIVHTRLSQAVLTLQEGRKLDAERFASGSEMFRTHGEQLAQHRAELDQHEQDLSAVCVQTNSTRT